MMAATARPAGGARRLLRVAVLEADPLALLVNIVAVAFVVGFVLAAIFRLGYTYALQVTEPATIVEVERIARGQSIYVEPTLQYIPMIYGPIYFYIAAAFAKLLGDSYLPLRLVSLLASIGALLLIAHLVWRETRNRSAALVAAGLYAATFPFSETGQDLGRVDALFTLLLIAAAYLARFGGRWWLVGSGVAMGLAALTKLPLGAAPLGLGLLAYIAFAQRWRAAYYVIGAAAVLSIGLVVLRVQTGPWGTWYIWDLPRLHEPRPDLIGRFWFVDLLPRFSICLVLGPLFIIGRLLQRDLRPLIFYAALALGLFGLSWPSRTNGGGAPNVLLPAFALAAIALGLGVHEAAVQLGSASSRARAFRAYAFGLTLVQFALLAYNPRITVPLRSDQWADERLAARLAGLPSPILAFDLDGYTRGTDKAGQPMLGPLGEIRGEFGGRGTAEGYAINAELNRLLDARAINYVVFDEKDCCMRDYLSAHGYLDAGTLFPPDDEFYLWKSWRTPDTHMFVAPGQNPSPPLPVSAPH